MFRRAVALALLALVAAALGQAPVIPANKMPAPPVIDGKIEAEEWKSAASFHGLVDAITGQPSPESGTFWLGYDDKFVYFAARLEDSQPAAIQQTEYRTNVGLPGDDNVELDIDLSGSLNDFSTFQANPRGATSISITGGRALKREWSGEFVAHGRTTANGWELEMKIPWHVMPLPKAGVRDVRFNVGRFIARLNREYNYVLTIAGTTQNTPIWKAVELPKSRLDRSIDLLPYMYAGAEVGGGPIADAGLDLKTSITDEVKLVGTLNPDFRNVENSILSLDFSRFARLAAESRPFFQEGAQYLGSALFSSQLIPRFDVGINSYGKIDDKTQFGFIDTLWFGKQSNTVLNSSYNPNPNDSYCVTLTQQSTPGNNNDASLIRYSRQLGPINLFARDMQSQDSHAGRGDDATGSVQYQKNGIIAGIEYDRVTPNFDPALGFTPETNYKGPSGYFNYDKPMQKGFLQDAQVSFSDLEYTRLDGTPYRRDPNGQVIVTTRSNLNVIASVDRPTFEGSHDRIDSIGTSYPFGNPYRNVGVTYTWGEIDGVPYRNAFFSTAYKPSKRFQFTFSYQHVDLGGSTDQSILTGRYDLGHERSISGRAVESNGYVNFYVAYSRTGNRGAEYFLILGDPNAKTFSRSLILKVAVPFKV